MTEWHMKSKRKRSGGIRTASRRSDKILAWKGGHAALTEASEKDKRKKKMVLGANRKVKQLKAKHASVTIPSTKKTVKAEIITVSENKANRLYTRRNIITKGAIIKVKIEGKEHLARVTSRPGQSGVVQAVLEEQKQ